MRSRMFLSLTLAVVCLTACGTTKATPTIAPVPSAGLLPLAASSTSDAPTAVAASVSLPTARVQPAPAVSVSTTSTALATPIAAIGTRTPVVANAARSPTVQPAATATTRTAQASATVPPEKAARMTDLPAVSPQQAIGTAQDGLVLLNIRVGKNDGFTRIVFDLAKQDGSAAPVPQTRLWREGNTVVVAFSGVRDDAYGQSLGGGEQALNTGVVQSVYRIPIRDDTAVAYGFAVQGGAKATLSSAASPTRVIVDVADK